ncbi:site-2 protease family protein [uncultured Litoreibacter sp.]|uniref:site-2 protease family protein n=1 Tax=uncultured Litoreibacter sp. TaxID=1392394 RepID=UPI002619EDD9|nr:site-2 protease family protein [uncultured Litoreibacter sp.]
MFGNENPIFEFRGPWGVPIQFGGSILLILLIFVPLGGSTQGMMYGALLALMLIGSILLHELGHAWGSLIQGVRVRRIMIYGGGGFCERSVSATRQQDELIVAMGPIVNLVIWALASLAAPNVDGMAAWALYWLADLNLFLAIFNLMPLMPLDGGKLFQLFLMRLLPSVTATRVCGWIGVAACVLWIPGMILVYYTYGFVLFFIPSIKLHWQMANASR